MNIKLNTPYYLIDESRMLDSLKKILYVKEHSGAQSVLALKCFSSWCAFEFMSQYLSGTTSSSLYEARLGHEKFPGETHGYSVAFDDNEIIEAINYCDKIIFNSLSQFERHKQHIGNTEIGLRVNPEIGHSHYKLSNTVARFSRLGIRHEQLSKSLPEKVSGLMFHMNCDNDCFLSFKDQIQAIENSLSKTLKKMDWISLGGGVAFTDDKYPLEDFCRLLKDLGQKYNIKIYLEPGEATVRNSTSLTVKVLDLVENEIPSLIVNAGVETHMLDALIYDYAPRIKGAQVIADKDIEKYLNTDKHIYRVCGRTCLAGDIFGTYLFDQPVSINDIIEFTDAGGYTMVKKNFFNGIKMPSIYYRDLTGKTQLSREFNYSDFRDLLS